MGRRKGPYNADFPPGTRVRVVSREELARFMANWMYHDTLEFEQLSFAGQLATVKSVGYYHGGDELYWLNEVPGTWHEVCLEPVDPHGVA